jgi:hypothetical protein
VSIWSRITFYLNQSSGHRSRGLKFAHGFAILHVIRMAVSRGWRLFRFRKGQFLPLYWDLWILEIEVTRRKCLQGSTRLWILGSEESNILWQGPTYPIKSTRPLGMFILRPPYRLRIFCRTHSSYDRLQRFRGWFAVRALLSCAAW